MTQGPTPTLEMVDFMRQALDMAVEKKCEALYVSVQHYAEVAERLCALVHLTQKQAVENESLKQILAAVKPTNPND